MAQLLSDEFKQIHDHLREHEKAINSLTIVIATVSAALLSAVGIFYFRLYSINPTGLNVAFSYLFLSPSLIVIPIMSAIHGHRESLYKMGLYIKVFFESKESGAMWHKRLEKYQASIKGESNDSVPYFAWVICLITYTFFAFSLSQLEQVEKAHYIIPAAILFTILAIQHYKHNQLKNIEKMESIWRNVKNEEDSPTNA